MTAVQHTPLDASTLGADAQRALSSGPAKMMAARGMAPIANPGDLVAVLYQLTIDGDPKVREAAAKSADDLPEQMLIAGLAAATDPRVLDLFAGRARRRQDVVQAIVLNQATADETVARIANGCESRIVDLIAGNEQRLLRHPEIIGALYMNRKARMSVVDRAVELAVRNGVRVPGVAAWDEIVSAIMDSGKGEEAPNEQDLLAADDAFAAALEKSARIEAGEERRDEEEEEKTWLNMSVAEKIRVATIGNSFERAKAIRDPKLPIAMAAVKSPMVKDSDAIKWASNHALAKEVVTYIANKRDWVQHYAMKIALVSNPKTPVTVAMRFVPHLRDKDVRNLSRSRGIPSAIVAQARKVVAQRSKGGRGRG